jgi:hypothetical protein
MKKLIPPVTLLVLAALVVLLPFLHPSRVQAGTTYFDTNRITALLLPGTYRNVLHYQAASNYVIRAVGYDIDFLNFNDNSVGGLIFTSDYFFSGPGFFITDLNANNINNGSVPADRLHYAGTTPAVGYYLASTGTNRAAWLPTSSLTGSATLPITIVNGNILFTNFPNAAGMHYTTVPGARFVFTADVMADAYYGLGTFLTNMGTLSLAMRAAVGDTADTGTVSGCDVSPEIARQNATTRQRATVVVHAGDKVKEYSVPKSDSKDTGTIVNCDGSPVVARQGPTLAGYAGDKVQEYSVKSGKQ